MAIFKGAGVAIVTPMYEDGKVNYDKPVSYTHLHSFQDIRQWYDLCF